VACDAGAKPAPPPAPDKVPAKAQWVATAIAGPNLAYLPADSDLFVHVDVAALRASKLWSTYEHDVAKLLVPGFECDDAPLHDAATVEIGVALKTGLGVFVIRGLDRDKTLRCLHASAAARFDGDVVTVTRGGETAILTFVDAATMVMQRGKQPTRATLTEVVRSPGAPLAQDPVFSTAMKHLPPKAGVMVLSRPNSEELRKKSGQLGVPYQYFHGSLDVTDQPATNVQLKFALVFATTDQATQLAAMMRGQTSSPQVKQMFDRFEVGAQGDTMTVDIGMSEPRLASLIGMFKSMLSMQSSN